jgi:DNA-binding NarL/FixJ family response regulator
MRILLLEDHVFFASEIVEYFEEETPHEIIYVKSYKEAVAAIEKYKTFDYAILDVILQNGKTGLDIARLYSDKLKNIMFLTGCCDTATLNALKDFIVVSKLEVIWPKLEKFFKGELKTLGETSTSAVYSAQA